MNITNNELTGRFPRVTTMAACVAILTAMSSGCGKDRCAEIKGTPENQLSMDDKMYFMEHCLAAEMDKALEDFNQGQ